jgi:hypothetical protein
MEVWMVAYAIRTLSFASVVFLGHFAGSALADDQVFARDTRVEIGFAIADQQGIVLDHDNSMQGLGSYLINANNSCNDCHTQPNFQPGGDPYSRQPKQVPLANYLAGGRMFPTPAGNFCSRNITPASGTNMPAGLSHADFLYVMHTGCDPQDANFRNPQTCGLLQIMPWPHYQDMKSQELNAMYSYLAALPSGSPPTTGSPAFQCVPEPQGVAGE